MWINAAVMLVVGLRRNLTRTCTARCISAVRCKGPPRASAVAVHIRNWVVRPRVPRCTNHTLLPQILTMLNAPFEAVNILEDELLRSGMKEFSQWPTFPQVYINGEFYGGCDIMIGERPLTPPGAPSSSHCQTLKPWLMDLIMAVTLSWL